MSNPPLSLALASDENYLDGLVGTLAGVVRNTGSEPIQAMILDCGISDADWRTVNQVFGRSHPHLKLQRRQIRTEQLAAFNPGKETRRLNDSAYARLLSPTLFPELDRIIYLDCDLHIDTDLHPLWRTPLNGAWLGAVQEFHLPRLDQNVPAGLLTPKEKILPAFNSGVMLMDLAAMRRGSLIATLTENMQATAGKLQDQAVLNYVLSNHWQPLHPRWNRQRFVTENFSIYRDYPRSIWHFIGKMKPWHFAPNGRRGIVADFHRNMLAAGWQPRHPGEWRPHSSAWRDSIKATRALALRRFRTVTS